MQKQKLLHFLILSTIILSFVTLAYSDADEYGNRINDFTLKQKVLGSYETRGFANYTTFLTGMNVSIEPDGDFILYATGKLNSTLVSDYGNATNYSHYALAVQVFDNVTYAQPLTWTLPAYQTGGFWILDTVDSITNNIVANTTVCNITEWINYQNGSGWLLAEEWVFNLQTTIITPPEIVYGDQLNFSIFWFWGFVITLFGTPLLIVATLKGGGASSFVFALMCFSFCITFYLMLASGV